MLQAGKKIKSLNSLGFHPITTDEYVERAPRDILLLGKRTWVVPKPIRKPGRPRKKPTIKDTLQYESFSSSDGDFDTDDSSGMPNRLEKYTCWF